MSYCRWSSDNFKSDLYVYEGVDGIFHIHIAGNRLLIPLVPSVSLKWQIAVYKFAGCKLEKGVATYPSLSKKVVGEIFWRYCSFVSYLQSLGVHYNIRKDIDLPYAGQTLFAYSALECYEKLSYLRRLGYRIPEGAFIMLSEDSKGALNESN